MRLSVSSPKKNQEESWKYDAQWSIFDELQGVSSDWWNSVSNAWYYFSKKMILEGEIKNVKILSSFHVISKHSFI